jgi:hypothetical protein
MLNLKNPTPVYVYSRNIWIHHCIHLAVQAPPYNLQDSTDPKSGNNVSVKLSLCLTKHYTMKMYEEQTHRPMFSWPQHQLEVSGQLHAPTALVSEKVHPLPFG